MAEIEQKHTNIASFDANDNEASMLFPALRITDDVNYTFLMTCELL